MRKLFFILLVGFVISPLSLLAHDAPLQDEHRLGPLEERVLKAVWQQEIAFKSNELAYFTKSGLLIDSSRPMNQNHQVNLLNFLYPNERIPTKKLPALNAAINELIPTMLEKYSGPDVVKGGMSPNDLWLLRITPRGKSYLKNLGIIKQAVIGD